MSRAVCKLLRSPVSGPDVLLAPDWKKASAQFSAPGRALVPSRGFTATQIVCGGGPKQKEGPIWGRSLRKLGLMEKWKDAKKERIKVAIERQKLERERRAIRRELQLAMEERRRAEHERKLAELARAGIIVEGGLDERAKKEDLLSALRTGQPVREPWQEGLEKITMKDIQETFATPVNLEALREAGVFDEKGVLGAERGRDRRATPEKPGDNDWGLRPAPREDQVSLDDLREIFRGGVTEGASKGGARDRVPRGVKSEIEEDLENREREHAVLEGITVPETVAEAEDLFCGEERGEEWEQWEGGSESEGEGREADGEEGLSEEEDALLRGEEGVSNSEAFGASKSIDSDLRNGLRIHEEDGEEDTWGDDDFEVLRERPVAAYQHSWDAILEEGDPSGNGESAEAGGNQVVNPYSGWVRVYTKPKKTKRGRIIPLEKRGNSSARIKFLLETVHERQEGEVGKTEEEQDAQLEQELMQAT
ncbi:hypothetical protein KFL_000980100 [Klebsormidium nitens]|uniref:Uncharacterized protein n=1 Tax=Klebsormidium nitens TaxID=105231 RepID=A0A0U9HJE8_KLENI|nr:hypothetical protein KFL_000980100 [Klebsormidium nitens]|eukprot:GAQ82023.1 hypothetical protein KFL_000980100 [Klebsormidium nitens]